MVLVKSAEQVGKGGVVPTVGWRKGSTPALGLRCRQRGKKHAWGLPVEEKGRSERNRDKGVIKKKKVVI